jgi:hypothetical protein
MKIHKLNDALACVGLSLPLFHYRERHPRRNEARISGLVLLQGRKPDREGGHGAKRAGVGGQGPGAGERRTGQTVREGLGP